MADKQFAVGGTRSAVYVEGDDPLAELARIVELSDLPPVNQPFDPSKLREPSLTEVSEDAVFAAEAGYKQVADLEGELLRAFEVYDAPHTAVLPPPAVNSNDPGAFADPMLSIDSSPVAGAGDDPSQAISSVAVQPAAVDPVVSGNEPAFEAAGLVDEPAPAMIEASLGSASLEQELLESLGQADFTVSAPVASVQPVSVPAATAKPVQPKRPPPPSFRSDGSFRLPMATFHKPVEDTRREEPESAASAAVSDDPIFSTVPDASEEAAPPYLSQDLPAAEVGEVVAPTTAPVAAVPHATLHGDNGIDALLDEVARYEVPSSRRTASSGLLQDPAFKASLAAITGVAVDIRTSDTIPSQQTPRREPEMQVDRAFAAGADEPDLENLFGPGDFELDLDVFEQQLSDLSLDDAVSTEPRLPVEEAREPFAEFVSETAAHGPSLDSGLGIGTLGAVATQEPVTVDMSTYDLDPAETFLPSSATTAPPAVRAADYAIDENVSFDPAMLPESEDMVEAVADIDVPEMHGEPEKEPSVAVPEYDLDIDAEMASLFGSSPPLAPGRQTLRADQAVSALEQHLERQFGMAKTPSTVPAGAFNEFERALENDFRNLLSQPLGQPQALSSGAPLDPPEAKREGTGGRTFRSVLLAAGATGAFALACVGGYLFLSGDIAEIASNEPRIIAADKGPVKVVPENPGGITVPNQDKAVYDRVAGKEADVVKQSTLVTTNEEPVDVVQKTLVPETASPLEAENESPPPVSTPVEDTTDARLLPAQTAAPAVKDTADQSAAAGGVAVRKVRTMIVKPDGTLVPREATSPEQAATTSPPSAVEAATQIPTTVPKAAASLTGDPASADGTIASLPENNTEEKTPDGDGTASDLSDSAPIPLPRPVDQPVNVTGMVTENGTVRQAPDAADDNALAMAAAATPATGSYGVQIASLPSEADAMASIPRMTAKFGGVLGGRNIGIRKADVPGKGTFYRLRVDVGSKQDAIDLCLRLKSAGGSCLVSR